MHRDCYSAEGELMKLKVHFADNTFVLFTLLGIGNEDFYLLLLKLSVFSLLHLLKHPSTIHHWKTQLLAQGAVNIWYNLDN